MERRAKAYLSRDAILHALALESLRRGRAKVFYAAEDGALLFDAPSGVWFLSCDTPARAEALVDKLAGAAQISYYQPFCRDIILSRFHFRNSLSCRQAVYAGAEPPHMDELPGVDFVRLADADCDTVCACYEAMDDSAYVLGRIRAGEMYGARRGAELLGFIGLHAEGTIGLLTVLPAQRRRGVARFLESRLIKLLLAKGLRPLTQIETDNLPSLRLHESLGFAISKDELYWLF